MQEFCSSLIVKCSFVILLLFVFVFVSFFHFRGMLVQCSFYYIVFVLVYLFLFIFVNWLYLKLSVFFLLWKKQIKILTKKKSSAVGDAMNFDYVTC